jgi:hypothetical protein
MGVGNRYGPRGSTYPGNAAMAARPPAELWAWTLAEAGSSRQSRGRSSAWMCSAALLSALSRTADLARSDKIDPAELAELLIFMQEGAAEWERPGSCCSNDETEVAHRLAFRDTDNVVSDRTLARVTIAIPDAGVRFAGRLQALILRVTRG